MPVKALLEIIDKVELFNELEQSKKEAVAHLFTLKHLEKGETLFEEESPRDNLYILAEGEIELFKKDPLGNEQHLITFGQYDFVGEGCLMEENAHHTTCCRTAIKTEIYIAHKDRFKELAETHPDIMIHVLSRVAKIISRRMSHAVTRISNISAQYMSGNVRIEHDLLGEMPIPAEHYYGIQTMRAIENFSISGVPINHFPHLIEGLAVVKMAAAQANRDIGDLDKDVAEAMILACHEIYTGKLHAQFVVDMIQGGAGTSTNMNANEVIANRALVHMGKEKGDYEHCHPNNHVNLAQSTNDAYPTALKLAMLFYNKSFVKALENLVESFRTKAKEFATILKMGRTQLQDAVPMTVGQGFAAYASLLAEEIDRINDMSRLFLDVNMGGTAIGTGINAHPDYAEKCVHYLREATGFDIYLADDLVAATRDVGSFVMYSSAIKRTAVKLSKICNDLRLLSSGPRAGINEINLPKMQPGSSIMPGKVNPVIPEVVNQIAFKVIGNDVTVTMAAEAGQLELNVMEPVIIQSILENMEMMINGMETLRTRCIDGITVNEDVCRNQVQQSIGLVTALNPYLGYEICSDLAKTALSTGKGVYDLVLERKLLPKEKLDDILDPENMVGPIKIRNRHQEN
jgi:aspartate ammonia-lyase